MTRPPTEMKRSQLPVALAGLIVAQLACAVFFLSDALRDLTDIGLSGIDFHLWVESIAALVLISGVVVEWQVLMSLLRRQDRMQRGLGIAAGALGDVIEGYFQHWSLTPAEEDVAMFTIKGAPIAEIARLRNSAEGTVKAHLNAIYRKAGVSGRTELVSLLIEDLMSAPLLTQSPPQS